MPRKYVSVNRRVGRDKESLKRWHANRRKTPLGMAEVMYRNIVYRCRNAHKDKNKCYTGIEIRVTLHEFISWAVPILSLWIESNSERPTVDRILSTGHYEIGNMRIVTQKVNNQSKASSVNFHAPEGTAFCSDCKQYRPTERFSPAPSRPNGFCNHCKDCKNRKQRERKARKANDQGVYRIGDVTADQHDRSGFQHSEAD